jgi:exopolysaccharide biosynthesis polyprenyl glycosylphosphotransferase
MLSWSRRPSPGVAVRVGFGLDQLALIGAIAISLKLEHGRFDLALHEFVGVAAVACGIWTIVSTALRHYEPSALERSIGDDVAMITVLVMAVGTCLAVGDLVAWSQSIPRAGHFIALTWPTVVALRLLLARPLSARESPLEEVLIVGIGPMGRLTGQDLARSARRRIGGYLAFPSETDRDRALLLRTLQLTTPILGTGAQLDSALRSAAYAEVYIAGNAREHASEMQQAIQVCERIGVPFALPAYSFRLERAWPLSNRDGYVHFLPNEQKPQQMAFKRLFDILASAAALWLFAPLLLLVTICILVTSRGPVFFRQTRVGLRGKPFTMLKFRSMIQNAEELKRRLLESNEQSGPVFKIRADPRVTWVGRFIRRYSIDELPQLINVLRGDMSIVGPRPPLPAEVERYEPWQLRRLSVRPGLTCTWQVSGRSEIPFEQWMYMDMQYIDHWSLRRDVDLIFKTIPAIFSGRGAS